MRHPALLLVALMLPVSALADDMLPGNATHGKQLLQAKCVACHARMFGGDGSAVYTRKNHTVHSIEGLMGRVAACNQRVGAHFSGQDVDDVVKYLNETYYKFKE